LGEDFVSENGEIIKNLDGDDLLFYFFISSNNSFH